MLWMLQALEVKDQSIQRFQIKMIREQPCGKKVLWDLLSDARSRAAVETLEKFLDGKATQSELASAGAAAWAAAGAWQANTLREVVLIEWQSAQGGGK